MAQISWGKKPAFSLMVFFLLSSLACQVPASTVTIKGHTFIVEVPQTPEDFYRGLGGRSHLAEDKGMLFVYPAPGRYSFWMKGMLIPIDVLWISEQGEIVDIAAEAQPEPEKPEAALTIYSPRAPALYVLEIQGGLTRKYGIRIGARVSLERIPAPKAP